MGWERRGRSGKLVYYWSRRGPDGGVVKEYVGSGPRAQAAAAQVEARCRRTEGDRRAIEREAARLAEVDALTAKVLAAAAL